MKVINRKFIDISLPIDQKVTVWPESTPVEFKKWKNMEIGDKTNDTVYSANVHTGTHIDAPLHYIKDGNSVDQIDFEKLIGRAYVREILGKKEITAGILQSLSIPKDTKRLLLKTDNSRLLKDNSKDFYKDFVALTTDAAQWIVDREIELVGIDYLSIQQFKKDSKVHEILLKAGIVILEAIVLDGVKQGYYTLVCLPMKLMGIEAAPVRAILYSTERSR